jgi:hypothetical protein
MLVGVLPTLNPSTGEFGNVAAAVRLRPLQHRWTATIVVSVPDSCLLPDPLSAS